MNTVTVCPSELKGKVTAPPSKSDAHRAILCAAMAGGVSTIHNIAFSNDVKVTIGCIEALGAKIEVNGSTLKIDGTTVFSKKSANLFCGESGSTLRFVIPIAAVGGVDSVFTGEGRLPQRPIGVYLDCLPKHRIDVKTSGGLPLEIKGTLSGGIYEIPGNISSQFITGLLLSLPLAKSDSNIVLTSPLESEGYINMTIKAMESFGVHIERTDSGYFIKGNQKYVPCEYTVEGDWSQAAFFFAAGAISSKLEIYGLNPDSLQGDRECVKIFKAFGADINYCGKAYSVSPSHLKATVINAEQIPDLVPILAVTAALAEGKTIIKNAARLRLKESDRLKAVCNGIKALGGEASETPDGLIIVGKNQFNGGFAEGCNDHRIVMSLAIAALKSNGNITVTDRESINKSYPDFFEVYQSLGGKLL